MSTLPKNLNIKFSESPPKLINEALEEPLKFTLDDLDEALPNIMEKGSPNVKEIFQEEPLKEKPTMDLTKDEDPSLSKDKETGEVNPNFVYEKPVGKLTKKGKPRKQMSEEQKQKARDNLKRARENKLAKKKALEASKPKKEVPIVEEKKVEQPSEPVAKQQVAQVATQGKYLSKEDLESSTLNAIMSYEKIRKERKAVKKEQQMIQAEKDKILNVARNHLHSSGWQSSAGRFNGCY